MSDEIREDHPSFAMIGVSHVSGNVRLNGSEFQHQHFISLSIRRAQKIRNLSREWWFGRDHLIEIAMSEAQFIELMARPNMGDGVPCTLAWFGGEPMQAPPEPKNMRERYRGDFQQDADRCVSELDAARAALDKAIEEGKIGKTVLRDIADKLKTASLSVKNGIPFVAERFEDRMETVVSHAAAEIEATVTQTAIRLGIAEMQRLAATSPKLIDEGKSE